MMKTVRTMETSEWYLEARRYYCGL